MIETYIIKYSSFIAKLDMKKYALVKYFLNRNLYYFIYFKFIDIREGVLYVSNVTIKDVVMHFCECTAVSDALFVE